MSRLSGRTVVVTGGGHGIGKAYCRRLAAEGASVAIAELDGDAAEELALYGASVDLLIVGSRGYGPIGRLVHGSTSQRLAHIARCPLLVLPRAAESAQDPDTAEAELETAAIATI